jgi:hypothetical protein
MRKERAGNKYKEKDTKQNHHKTAKTQSTDNNINNQNHHNR